MKYGEIIDFIKKKEKDIDFVNMMKLGDFVVEQRVTRKKKYVVKLEFDAEQILKNPESVATRMSDFVYQPYLLFLKYKDKEKDGKQKK